MPTSISVDVPIGSRMIFFPSLPFFYLDVHKDIDQAWKRHQVTTDDRDYFGFERLAHDTEHAVSLQAGHVEIAEPVYQITAFEKFEAFAPEVIVKHKPSRD